MSAEHKTYTSVDYDGHICKVEITLTNFKSREPVEIITIEHEDPVVALYEHKRWLLINLDKYNVVSWLNSSSVDHFYMDNTEYFEKYIVFDESELDADGNMVDGQLLTYAETVEAGYDPDKYMYVCVTEGFKTFAQLKTYVKTVLVGKNGWDKNQRSQENI